MQYRVTSRILTRSGPPGAICRLKSGTTLPSDPRTLPNRTTRKSVAHPCKVGSSSTMRSAMRFVAPRMLVGLIALSVEIRMNLVTPCAAAHSATRRVPNTLFHTASTMLDSSIGTRSEEHTSELQSPCNLVCRLLLEKKKKMHQHR